MRIISEWLADFEKQLHGLIAADAEPRDVYDPINHILSIGGKRVRPLMVLAAHKMYQPNWNNQVTNLALAVEMFHNFTLLHDDIMDKAPLRRGVQTVHEKWDTATAILSGDLLQILVYEKLNSIGNTELTKLFNQMAVELCEGQMMDMMFEKMATVNNDSYLDMIRKKTAVLLGFSLQAGGLLADVSDKEQQNLYDLGISLGLAFQLMDDYLDSFGESAAVGKRIGNDILEKKKTYLWNCMYDALSVEEKTELKNQYASQNEEAIIEWIKEKMTSTGAKKQTLELAEHYAQKGQHIFDQLHVIHDAGAINELMQLLNQRKN
jgi:geranylgeranyl diphosphate synthase type II